MKRWVKTLLGLAADVLTFAGGWCFQHAAFLISRPLGYAAIGVLFLIAAGLAVLAIRRYEDEMKGGGAD